MNFAPTRLLAGAIACLMSTVASAAIIYDFSPSATGLALTPSGDGSILQNEYAGYSFVAPVQFTEDVLLTGIDIFTSSSFASVGQAARILLFSDTLLLTSSFTESISSVSPVTVPGDTRTAIVIAHADFSTPISIAANTFFFIGMSGDSTNLGLYGLDAGGPNGDAMGVVQNSIILGVEQNFNPMAFRLHASVPDTGTNALQLTAGLVVLFALRKRFKK